MERLQKALLAGLFCLTCSLTYAQTSIGIKGGINYTNISQPDILQGITPKFRSIAGANIALVSEVGISDHFAIQPELGYSQKGFKIEEGMDLELFNVPIPIGGKAVTKLNYLEAPVLAKLKFGNPVVEGYVAAGPLLSYTAGGRFKTVATILVDIPISNTKLDLDRLGFERFDVGAAFATGLTLHTKGGSFFTDIRYTRGFNNVYDIPIVEIALKNTGIGVNVGYMMPLTRKAPVTERPRA